MHATAASFNASDHQERALINFFKSAAAELFDSGYEDPAFYFDQVAEHLRNGGNLNESVTKILGL
jgi:hypothetical protein